jgi:hypothetical protein
MIEAKYTLDYKLIGTQIDRLLESVVNKFEREWPKSSQPPTTNEAHFVVVCTLRNVANTFKTIRYLCADKSSDWRHRPEIALSTPPLIRTILDSFYTIIFLFEDIRIRAEWYMQSGWKELAECVDRVKRDYGSDPVWKEYLDETVPRLEELRTLVGKPENELRERDWWPTPPQMKRYASGQGTIKFFEYLSDWYYKEFSAVSHLSLPGLIQSVTPLMKGVDEARIEQLRGYYFIQATILLIAIYSEIEGELRIGVAADLKYVWQMLLQHYPFAKEIYQRRNYDSRVS